MNNISKACAVVFSSDGTHTICATADQVIDAIDCIVASGHTPTTFTRKASRPPVTNSVTGPVHGHITQAHTIHNGVRL